MTEKSSQPSDEESVLTLPKAMREDLKEPIGPIFEEAQPLIEAAGTPLLTIGDIVTYSLLRAGRPPDVAVVDEQTKRSSVEKRVRETIVDPDAEEAWFDHEIRVENPQSTLTVALGQALRDGLDTEDSSTVIIVEGEEDLATLPAIVAAPRGSSVVYGQPGEGMVLVTVDGETQEFAQSFLSRMDGDHEQLIEILDV